MIRRIIEGAVRELLRPLLRQFWKELRVEILTQAARSENEIDDRIADVLVQTVDKALHYNLNANK